MRITVLTFVVSQGMNLVILGAVLGLTCVSEAFLLGSNPAIFANKGLNGRSVLWKNSQETTRSTFIQPKRNQARFGLRSTSPQMKLDLAKANPKDVRVLVAGSTGTQYPRFALAPTPLTKRYQAILADS